MNNIRRYNYRVGDLIERDKNGNYIVYVNNNIEHNNYEVYPHPSSTKSKFERQIELVKKGQQMLIGDLLKEVKKSDYTEITGSLNKPLVDDLILSGLCGVFILNDNHLERVFVYDKSKFSFTSFNFTFTIDEKLATNKQYINFLKRFVYKWMLRKKEIKDNEFAKIVSVYCRLQYFLSVPNFLLGEFYRDTSKINFSVFEEIGKETRVYKCPHCNSNVIRENGSSILDCPNGHKFTV